MANSRIKANPYRPTWGDHSQPAAPQRSDKASPAPTDSGKSKPSGPPGFVRRQVPILKRRAGDFDAKQFWVWGPQSETSVDAGLVKLGGVDVSADLSKWLNFFGIELSAVDAATTLLATANTALTFQQARSDLKRAEADRFGPGLGPFTYQDKSAAYRVAKGDAFRALAPVLRDDLGQGASLVSRVATADGVPALLGTPWGGVATGGFSGAMYLWQGVMLDIKANKATNRAIKVQDAFVRAQRSQEAGAGANTSTARLDKLFSDQEISPNVYQILRGRSEADVHRFLTNWNNLGDHGKERLTRLLHFSGVYNRVFQPLNFSWRTNLNTSEVRRVTREAIIDAFVSKGYQPDWLAGAEMPFNPDAAAFFDDLRSVRKDAIGATVAPNSVKVEEALRVAGIDPKELGTSAVRAIARSGCCEKFIERYNDKSFTREQKAELRGLFHFGAWRVWKGEGFWKEDGTWVSTKSRRADIRAALAEKFADGMSLDRLAKLKDRYNQKVVPVQGRGAHARPLADSAMINHVIAAQKSHLDDQREAKGDARVRKLYGGFNLAGALAESGLNPFGLTGGSLSAGVLGGPYLLYAGWNVGRSVNNRRHTDRISAEMREEASLLVLPRVKASLDRYVGSGRYIRDLPDYDDFLKNELGLSEKEVKRLLAIEKAGDRKSEKRWDVRTFLARKNPEANVLLTMRRMANEDAAKYGGDPDAWYAAWKSFALYAETHPTETLEKIAEAQELVRQRHAQMRAAAGQGAARANPPPAVPSQNGRGNPAPKRPPRPVPLAGSNNGGTASGNPGSRANIPPRPARQTPPGAARTSEAWKEVAEKLREHYAQSNPVFATRQFVDELLSDNEQVAADAANALRVLNFGEMEIEGLKEEGKASLIGRRQLAAILGPHLLGESVRRRFSPRKLSSEGRRYAAAAVDRVVQLNQATAREPLTWRLQFEKERVEVIENVGAPGIDSMLHALQQHFVGRTDCSTKKMRASMAKARQRVIAQIPAADRDQNVMAHVSDIVRIAAETFGDTKSTVLIKETGVNAVARFVTADGVQQIRPTPAEKQAASAVICFDGGTNRAFVLDGVSA